MPNTSGYQWSVGSRYTRIYELVNGYPMASTTSGSVPYEGYQLSSVESCQITIPEPRPIEHVGDDRLQQKDFLPPVTGSKVAFVGSRNDYNVYAILTGTKVLTQNEHVQIGVSTNKQGANPQIGIMQMQQSLNEVGVRNWRATFVPKCIVYPLPGSYEQTGTKVNIPAQPQLSNVHLWGTQMTAAADGYTSTELVEAQFTTQPWIASWFTSGSATTVFTFNTLYPASGSSKVTVLVNGTEISGSIITKTTTGFTLTNAVSGSTNVVALYELGVSVP
jgi:hypothetical protein